MPTGLQAVTDVGGADKVTLAGPDRSGNNWNAEAESSDIGPAYADSVLGVNGQPLLDFSQVESCDVDCADRATVK
jgi:hypothetical protein